MRTDYTAAQVELNKWNPEIRDKFVDKKGELQNMREKTVLSIHEFKHVRK